MQKLSYVNHPSVLQYSNHIYPELNLYLFLIYDYHYEKAVFVSSKNNKPLSRFNRFLGSYGAMSKDKFWIGLKRENYDNSLQLEICKITEKDIQSIFKFNFSPLLILILMRKNLYFGQIRIQFICLLIIIMKAKQE